MLLTFGRIGQDDSWALLSAPIEEVVLQPAAGERRRFTDSEEHVDKDERTKDVV